jgi:branched-chain amino acid transport system substrate-binding protein
MFLLSNVAIWVNSVMAPAGVEKGVGIISSAYVTIPGWDDDSGKPMPQRSSPSPPIVLS